MALKTSLFVPPCGGQGRIVSQGKDSEKNVFETIFTLLKVWAMQCQAMTNHDGFIRQGRDMDAMAEAVRRAGRILEKHGAGANEKARILWMSLPACVRLWGAERKCAADIRTDMLRCVADHKRQSEAIKAEIMGALSFLDADPEVDLVVQAHLVLEQGYLLMDAVLLSQHTSALSGCVLRHSTTACCCHFELLLLAAAPRETE